MSDIKFVLMILFGLMSVTLIHAAGGDMGGGNGQETTPYLIEDFDDFLEFSDPCYADTYWAAGVYTHLVCNLDLDPALPGRQVYPQAPIAGDTDTDSSFDGVDYAGHFDGNGHIITNLTINGAYHCGLFGQINSSAFIDNVSIENAEITSSNRYVSILVGTNYNGSISGCHITGSMGGDRYVGGLVGWNSGSISNSHSSGSVTGSVYVGGLVGTNYGSIIGCYATGDVIGSGSLGGLVGDNYGSISSSYATGNVNGTGNLVGGLVGYNEYNGNISESYSIGLVTGDVFVGGLIGYTVSGCCVNCYWDMETSGKLSSAGGEPKTTAQLKDSITFIGWNNSNWTIDNGNNHPRLTWENAIGIPITTDYPTATYSGSGTALDPFVLLTPEDLVCMSRRVPDWASNFVLANDIDMTGVIYVPVVEFSGSFDGTRFLIQNLNIDSEMIGTNSILGFLGRLTGEVNNLGLVNIIVNGDVSVGALAGYNSGSISNCYATGSIIGFQHVGGLAGLNDTGDISNSYYTGSISGFRYVGGLVGENNGDYNTTISVSHATGAIVGDDHVGGLIGYNSGSFIINCYSSGAVTGKSNVGGLMGYNSFGIVNRCYATGIINGDWYIGGLMGYNGGYVSSCYAMGDVTGDDDVGGLMGRNFRKISDSFSTGTVSGNSNVGGLIGSNDSDNISSCFWDKNSSGCNGGVGEGSSSNVVGKTTLQMQTLSTFVDALWDFDPADGDPADWKMREKPYYPILNWQRDVYADVAFDGLVNLRDFDLIRKNWLLTPADPDYLERCDLVDDDIIDGADLAVMIDYWLYPDIPGDVDYQNGVNLSDFVLFKNTWQAIPADPTYNPICNLDNSGTSEDIIDIADVSIFCENWLAGE